MTTPKNPAARLLAYLTDDVVRISPRWVAWLEVAMIAAAFTVAVVNLLRRLG